MKIKWKLPKKALYGILTGLVALAVIIVVVIACVRAFKSTPVDPHAGHNHGTETVHTDPTYNANLTPADSYTLTENKDGTYSYEVKNRMGGVFHSKTNLTVKPTFTQVDQHVLCITGMEYKENNLSGWAVFCNIQYSNVYQQRERVLGTYKNRVAFLDYRTEKWLVFVDTAFGAAELKATELPDLAIQQSGNPELEYTITKSGDLKVVYTTKKGKESVTIKLGE